MTEAIHPIRVDVVNNLEGQADEVQFAVAGLAYITAGLISVGEVGVVAPQPQHLESLFDRINSSLSNPGVGALLEQQHPTFTELIEETERYTTSSSFRHFLQRLGVFDTSYILAPSEDNPNHLRLSFLGYD